MPIFRSAVWNRSTARERANVRRHIQARQLSRFLHGEQGALACAAEIVQQVPSIDAGFYAKFYAATQVMDEARHVASAASHCATIARGSRTPSATRARSSPSKPAT